MRGYGRMDRSGKPDQRRQKAALDRSTAPLLRRPADPAEAPPTRWLDVHDRDRVAGNQ